MASYFPCKELRNPVRFSAAEAYSRALLATGATANLACFKRLDRRSSVLKEFGVLPAQQYPARARFEFGEGRLIEVRYAIDVPAGTDGGRGKFTAFLMGADIPALL